LHLKNSDRRHRPLASGFRACLCLMPTEIACRFVVANRTLIWGRSDEDCRTALAGANPGLAGQLVSKDARMTANYMVITAASGQPSYIQEALEHLGPLVRELKEKAGCVGARYGTMGTGADAGSLALFQSYAGLADIEKVFNVYATSSAYQKIMTSGKLTVTLRNIVKLEDVQLSNPSMDTPKYGVVTVLDAPTLTNERIKDLMPVFEQSGAILMRYGALITGSNAGKRVAAVAYPSMDAIEKSYDGLRASGDYQKLMNEATLVRRDIVRFAG
jgi:hypothetical protein